MNSAALKIEPVEILHPRLKLVERDCPKCDSIVIRNEKEDCYECMVCGHIDCGYESIHLKAVG